MMYPDIKNQTELYKGLTVMDELYDLQKDQNELHNLAENPEYSSKLKEMKKTMNRQLTEINAPPITIPSVAPSFQIHC